MPTEPRSWPRSTPTTSGLANSAPSRAPKSRRTWSPVSPGCSSRSCGSAWISRALLGPSRPPSRRASNTSRALPKSAAKGRKGHRRPSQTTSLNGEQSPSWSSKSPRQRSVAEPVSSGRLHARAIPRARPAGIKRRRLANGFEAGPARNVILKRHQASPRCKQTPDRLMAAINTLRLARLAPSEPTEIFSVARTPPTRSGNRA